MAERVPNAAGGEDILVVGDATDALKAMMETLRSVGAAGAGYGWSRLNALGLPDASIGGDPRPGERVAFHAEVAWPPGVDLPTRAEIVTTDHDTGETLAMIALMDKLGVKTDLLDLR